MKDNLASKKQRTDIVTENELTGLLNPEIYTDKAIYLYAVCCRTGALRTGETRGLRVKQILFDRKTLVVDGFVKRDGTRTDYAKQGTEEHTKFRMIPLPVIHKTVRVTDYFNKRSIERTAARYKDGKHGLYLV